MAGITSVCRNAREPSRLAFYWFVEKGEKNDAHFWRNCLKADWAEQGPPPDITIQAFDPARILSVDNSSTAESAQSERLRYPHNYIRFYFPELLPKSISKILYLDADTIVRGDVCALWDSTLVQPAAVEPGLLTDEPIVAAAAPSGAYLDFKKFANTSERVFGIYMDTRKPAYRDWLVRLKGRGFPDELISLHRLSNAPAYNAGVLMVRLDLWRRDRVTEDLEWWLTQKHADPTIYGLGTQPPLLLASYGRTELMDPTWNVLIAKKCQFLDESRRATWAADPRCTQLEGPEVMRPRVEEANIVHWSTKDKPWLLDTPPDFVGYYKPYEVNMATCWFSRYLASHDPTVNLQQRLDEMTQVLDMYSVLLAKETDMRQYCTQSKTWLNCDTVLSIEDLQVFAFGMHKMASHGRFRDEMVVVGEPNFMTSSALGPYVEGALPSNVRRHLRDYFLDEQNMYMKMTQSAKVAEYVPQFYGGCYSEGERHLANVYQYLQGYPLVSFSPEIDLPSRLRIASSTARLAKLFEDYYDPVDDSEGSVIYSDMYAGQFGVDFFGNAKLVDITSQVQPYSPGERYGSDLPCDSDDVCLTFYFNGTHPLRRKHRVFKRLRTDPPLDFGCDMERRQCRGLDHLTNLYGLCRLAIEPMFIYYYDYMDGADVSAASNLSSLDAPIRELLDGCLARDPADRLSIDAVMAGFNNLVPTAAASAKLPVLDATLPAMARSYRIYDEILAWTKFPSCCPPDDVAKVMGFLNRYESSLYYRTNHWREQRRIAEAAMERGWLAANETLRYGSGAGGAGAPNSDDQSQAGGIALLSVSTLYACAVALACCLALVPCTVGAGARRIGTRKTL